jgi:hypothetical protein
LTLFAVGWTLTHRSGCALEVALGLGLGVPVLVAASRVADVADGEAEVADGEAEVAEGDADGEYGPSGVCRREADGDGDAGASLPGLLLVAEGLGDGVGEGVAEGDGDGENDGEGDGEGEAVAGSAWHCLPVVVAGAVEEEAATALSCRLVNTPRVRNPPVSKLIIAALTYPERIVIACLRCSSGFLCALGGSEATSKWMGISTHIRYQATYARRGRRATVSGAAGLRPGPQTGTFPAARPFRRPHAAGRVI